MEKLWYTSKTVWGGILLGLEAGLIALPGMWIWPEAIGAAVGVFLTIWGFRDAQE